jgi:glycosyltransferase involved in cell wall biosynthesis
VRFLGELRGDALADVYACADVFCFPSTTDTFGQVILEAAASGLPAVAAGAGGGLELVRAGETGFVVPPDDPIAFMHALAELAENETLRLALGGRALVFARSRSWAKADAELVMGYAAAVDQHLQDLGEPRPALSHR